MEASNAASVQELREGEQFIADTERELEVVQTQMREVSEVLGAVEASQLHNLVEELTGTTN